MAGTPEVKVRVSADNKDLDAGLAGAGRSLGDFVGNIPLVGAAVAAAGAAVAAFAKGAVDEAAKAEVGMVRLGTAVTNAGGDFRKMSPGIEQTVSSVQRLTKYTDDDLRAALTNMVAISGDVAGSQKNLALVADVAAFKQIDLAEAGDLVGKAMTGNTKVLGAFGNEVKNAANPMEALRQTVGGYAEKEGKTFSGSLQRINNQWGEFQEAVGKAILGGGEASSMADGLAGVLANLVGWVEKNEGAFIVVKEAVFGAVGALFEIGKTIYDVVQPALGPVLKVLFGALLVSLNTATLGVRTLTGFFKGMAGDVLTSLGTIVEKGGKLLKIFGIDVVTETGASLKEFGVKLSTSAKDQVADAQASYKAGMMRLFGDRTASTREMETLEDGHQKRVTGIHARGHEERLTKAQEKAELMKLYMSQANEIFASTTKALEESTRPVLRDMKADWSAIDEKVKAAAASIGIAKDAQKLLGDATEGVRDKQKKVLDEVEKSRVKFLENVDTAKGLGLAVLGVATNFGVVKGKAAETLEVVISTGAELVKYGFASPQGLLAVIGGLSKLIGGASPKASAAVQKNTEAVEQLSRDFGDYSGGASGTVFQGTLSALDSLIGDVDISKLNASQRTALAVRVRAGLPQALSEAGITMQEAKNLASKYGIDVDGDPLGWAKLLQILKTRKFGSAEGNFADELSSIEDSFGVLGIDDQDDQLAAFSSFVDKNIPALKGTLGDLSTQDKRDAAVARLKQLYKDSIMGKLAPGEYGRSSPAQFRQIVGQLIQLLGGADGFLGSAQSVTGATPPNPTGGGTLPGAGASAGTSGLVTGGVGPTVGVGSSAFGGFELGGASIGTQNNTVTLNVQSHPDESAALFAERIAELVSVQLGQKYNTQRAALGIV